MTTEDSAGKPHKVWSCDRQTRKCVVASCLDELRTKGAAKLGYSNPFDLKIVLEIDGTEVEDENYFQRAERDTVFLMLQPSEKWLPPGVEALRAGHDETDGDVGTLPVLNRKCLDPLSLLRHLEKDASSVVHFTEEQLELVSEVPKESLDPRMFNLSFVETVRDTCGRLLVERREAQEAIDLIKILARSSQEAFSDAKPGNARADSKQTGETSGEDDKDRISGHDETDRDVGTLPVLNRKCLDPLSLLRHLEKDASSVAHFTEEQLELVSKVPKWSPDPRVLNLSFLETERDTCERLLFERRTQKPFDALKILAQLPEKAFSDAKPGNTRADSKQTGETSGEDDKDRISGRPTKKPKTG